MDDAPHILVKPASGVSPEDARNVRARAWAFVFECFDRHEKEATSTRSEEDASNGFANEERSRA